MTDPAPLHLGDHLFKRAACGAIEVYPAHPHETQMQASVSAGDVAALVAWLGKVEESNDA